MSENVQVLGDSVFEVESLVRDVNQIDIKTKFTININPAAIQKVVNVTDNQGPLENVVDQLTVFEEGHADRGPECINNVAERGVSGGRGVTSMGAKVKGQDVKDSGLPMVGWRGEGDVGGVSFERRNHWKNCGVVKQGVVAGEV
jgi:hypothetical protein